MLSSLPLVAPLPIPGAGSPNREMALWLYVSSLLFLLGDNPQKFCWIPGHNGIVRNVLGDHAARTHDGVISYRNFAQNRRARSDRSAFAHHGIFHFPVRFGLQFAFRGSRSRVGIVDKSHAVANEDVVLYVYALTDKRMTGNFAAPADAGIFLNLHKCADLGFVSNLASIHVDEFGELDVLSQLYIRGNAYEFVHSVTASPRFRTDLSAASRMRTTRNPAMPSLKGFLFSSMHFRK